jgi:hypothetical protein
MTLSFSKSPFLCTAVTAIVILLANACGSGKGSEGGLALKLNLKKGDVMQVETKIEQEVETEAMGNKMTIRQNFLFDFETLVDDINSAGNYVIRNTYKRVKLSQNIPGIGENVLDTDDPSASKGAAVALMEPILKALVGKSFIIEMTPRGQVVKTDMSEIKGHNGLDDISDNSNLSDLAVEYPDKPLRPGDTWEAVREVSGKMPMRIITQYTLREIKDGLAILDMKSEIKPHGDQVKVSGTMDGTMQVDVNTGWTRESRLNQNMQMTVSQGGIEMPMKMASVISMTSR